MIIKKIRLFLISFCLAALLPAAVFSAPPKDWKFPKSKPEGFRPCRPITAEMRGKLKARTKGVISKAGAPGVSIKPEPKILVIRVTFKEPDRYTSQDRSTFTLSQDAQEAFFDTFRDYFIVNSYGQLVSSVTLTREFPLPRTIDSYNIEDNPYGTELLLLKDDAVTAALSGGVDFSPFDYVMIYHVGYGEEESGDPADIWSLFFGASFVVDGKTFEGFTIVPELSKKTGNSSLGVVCHEFGHQLGLPDLYDTSVYGGASTCGAWSLMDYPYGFDNTGAHPPHMDVWCKDYLGFIDPDQRIISGDASLLIYDIETSSKSGYYKIPSEVSPDEYFLLEYRASAYSQPFADPGVLIWHIDDAWINANIDDHEVNNDPRRLGVDLVEADSLIKRAVYPPGRPENAFRSKTELFGSPLSDSYSGRPLSIVVTDFQRFPGYYTASATKLLLTADTNLTKTACFPNPAGKGYPHPAQGAGIISTIVFKATRPPDELTLHLYTMAGERLVTASKNDFALRVEKSQDYQWVYEYDWDGRNESGDDVAPGLYFYLIKAGKEVKTGKMAVVR